jgi:adenylate cyclase
MERADSTAVGSLESRIPKWLIAIGLAAAATLVAAGLARLPLFETLELKTYDLRARRTAAAVPVRDDVVLVDIDQASLRQLEPLVGRWPWPRLVHAQLVEWLTRSLARVVLYDVLFTERDRRSFTVGRDHWSGEESDNALASAVARAGNVVLIADVVSEASERAAPHPDPPSSSPLSDFHLHVAPEERPIVVLPVSEFARAARTIGHNLMVLDDDGPLRRVVPFVSAEGRAMPSAALATALVAARTPAVRVDMTRDRLVVGETRGWVIEQTLPSLTTEHRTGYRMLLDYGGSFRRFSFYDLFYAEQQMKAGLNPGVDPSAFRDKIVIVGTTAPGLADVFPVPLAGKVSGSEIHATFIENVLSGRFMRPASSLARWSALIVCALVIACIAVWRGPWTAVFGAAGAFAALWWTGVTLFRSGLWLPIVEPSAAIIFATFAGTGYQYLIEGREKRKVKQLFSQFVSPAVYQQLLNDPRRAALGGERREMSVLFCDIRGFTSIAEVGDPESIVATLNKYFSCMVPIVFAHHGTIDKFVGDMIMALFGAPLDDSDHADHAVESALAIVAALDPFNRERAAAGRPPLEIGIGINSGEMVAGIIGSEHISSYTVIGDAVNLGSRLESLNKQYSTRIIISEATRERLKKRYDMRPLGQVTVKGRSQPVSIYEVQVKP